VVIDLDENRQRARAAREALVGKTIASRYVLRALLGHGGMGAVYEAEHLGLGKRVAIKFVDPEFATDENVVARFAREARAMSAIESAHIVSVFDAGTEDGRPYLVMELLRGEDLGERLRRLRRVPLREAMHVAAQVLKGLARAHAAGIIHRDLKPDNVFLVKHDIDPLFAKIVDFGISKIERPRADTHPLALTGRGTVLGTPFYMSPEQAQASSDVDGRTDLYSVGAILFECLTGRPPHTGESYEQVILSICMSDAPLVSSFDPALPANVVAFVARALARDRDQRFKSAERMLAALHEVAPEERTRVPLDPPSAETLESAVAPSARTMLDGSVQRASAPASSEMSAATRLGVGTLGPDALGVLARATPVVAEAPPPPPADVEAARAAASSPLPPRLSVPATAPSPGGAAVRAAAPKPARSLGTAVVTAALATLTGVGATYGVITMLDKRSGPDPRGAPARSAPVTNASVAVAPSAPVLDAGAAPSVEPVSTSSALPATEAPDAQATTPTPSTRPSGNNGSPPASGSGKLPALPGPRSSATARPTSTKPLDIQRDLP